MSKLAGLLLVILTAIVLISMPSFKGLSVIQLNRTSDLPVGLDPGGAQGIIDLDQGLSGAIVIGGSAASDDRYIGTIANNFDFQVQLEVTVLISTVASVNGNPWWRNINIFFDHENIYGERERVEALEFNDIRLSRLPAPQQLTTGAIVLNSGEALVVSLDGNSSFSQAGNISDFEAQALFTITGNSTGDESITFTIEPKDDLRKQYFTK
jgi:hypothetical protein